MSPWTRSQPRPASPGSTVYVYFANRDDLLRACVQSMYDRLQDTVAVVLTGRASPVDRLRGLILGLLERIDESPAFFRLAMATQATATAEGSAAVGGALMLIGLDMIRVLEELVVAGVAAGDFRADLVPERAVVLIGQQIYGALSVRAGEPDPIPAPEAADEICASVRRGLEDADVKFDLWLPTASPMTTAALLDAVATGAEERGIGTIWVGEHVVLFDEYESLYPYADDGRIPAPPGSGLLEPMVTLTYLAARTATVRLGTAMLLLPQRNPVYTAKEVSTLDWLSDGRVDLGVGVGWLQEEFDVLNVPWERRGRRTDEYLEVLRTLWLDETSSFHGEVYDLPACEMYPKPVQQPPPRPHRRRDAGRVAPGRPPRPGLAHLQPVARRAGRGPGRARSGARGGRAQPRRAAHHGLPLLQPADARMGRAVRRGRRRRGGRPLLRLHPR